LNVIENAKNIFSRRNAVEFVKSVLKIAFLSALIAFLTGDSLRSLLELPVAGFAGVGLATAQLLKLMMINVGLAYLVVSVADLGWQRFEYRKKLMMTKDEVKREYREMEGDPQIRHQRKQLHQEMLRHSAVRKAGSASVIVTNPTHLAIALHYESGKTALPIVLAKGEGALATQMIAAAREAGVPVLQNIPLAHALHEQALEDQYIPSDLVEAVAEVLRLARKIASARDGDGASLSA
jgi:type III secretion protein U